MLKDNIVGYRSVYINNIIDEYLDKGFSEFVIYPYGELGNIIAQRILSKNGKVKLYIDNFKCDNENIFNIEQAKEILSESDIILISSANYNYYEEIRNNIYKAFPNLDIVDLFENDMFVIKKNLREEHPDVDGGTINALAVAQYLQTDKIQVKNTDVFAGNFKNDFVKDSRPDSTNQEIELIGSDCDENLIEYIKDAENIGLLMRSPGNHFVPDYSKLLNLGLDHLLQQYRDAYSEKESIFLANEIMLIEAFKSRIERYITCLKELIQSGNCSEYSTRMLDSLEWISCNSARDFYDAIQLVILQHEVITIEGGCGSISFGRIDQYLYPFYKRDIEVGKLTKKEAFRYVKAFWEKCAAYPMTWQNVTIGGTDCSGNDVANDITYMCIEAAKQVRGDQPQLSLRIHESTPDKLWNSAIDLIKEGLGFPSLFNDEVVYKTRRNSGISDEDARDYSIMGCVELCTAGKDYSHNEGIRFNFAKVLELVLSDIAKGNIAEKDIEDFNSFYDIFKSQFIDHIRKLLRFGDIVSGTYPRKWSTPMASVFMKGTLEKQKDVTDNGTIYNNLAINGVGFATVVDSLYVIKKMIYEEHYMSIEDLAGATNCGDNWDTELQKRCLGYSKYGNGDDEVDVLAADFLGTFTGTVSEYPLQHRTGVALAGLYTSYYHADFGKVTGKTPDGRNAKEPLSPSMGTTAGRDKNGILALVNSVNKLNLTELGNGMALDIRFLPTFFDKKENCDAIKQIIKVYFKRGGLEVQINVVDNETLRLAQKNPELYSNLVVRVSGYSARFVHLDKKLQDEIISRTANA